MANVAGGALLEGARGPPISLPSSAVGFGANDGVSTECCESDPVGAVALDGRRTERGGNELHERGEAEKPGVAAT